MKHKLKFQLSNFPCQGGSILKSCHYAALGPGWNVSNNSAVLPGNPQMQPGGSLTSGVSKIINPHAMYADTGQWALRMTSAERWG